LNAVIKWWRSDNKCGKKDLFDISNAEVLTVRAPEGATEIMLKSEIKEPKIYKVYDCSKAKENDEDSGEDGWYTKTGRKRKQKKIVVEKRPYKRRKLVDGVESKSKIPKSKLEPVKALRGRPRTIDPNKKPAKLGRPRSMPMDGHNDSSLPPNAVLSASGTLSSLLCSK
jgi:hypothetical protein